MAQDLGPAEKLRTVSRLGWMLAAIGLIALAAGGLLWRSYWTGTTIPPSTDPGLRTGTQTKAAGDYAKSLDKAYGAATSQLDEVARKIAGEDKPTPTKEQVAGKEQPKASFSPVGRWVMTRRDLVMKSRVCEFSADKQVMDMSSVPVVVLGTASVDVLGSWAVADHGYKHRGERSAFMSIQILKYQSEL